MAEPSLVEIQEQLQRIEGMLADLMSKPKPAPAAKTPAESRLEMQAISRRARQVGLKQALEEFGRAPKPRKRAK